MTTPSGHITGVSDCATRPHAVSVQTDGIPSDLRTCRQWVLWRYDLRKGKWSKVPYAPAGHRVAANDPATWSDFDEVARQYASGVWDGIGFVFSDDDPYVGIDLDACRNPETGELTKWAKQVVDVFGSYCEVSPSGYGVKIVVRGRLPIPEGKTGKAAKLRDVTTFGSKSPEIAAYQCGRYWCLTGRLINAAGVVEAQGAIDALFEQYFSGRKATRKPPASNGPAGGTKLDELIEACRAADDGTRSERDFALCAEAVRRGWQPDGIWDRVKGISKFSERGRDYFDATWAAAAERQQAADLANVTNGMEEVVIDDEGKEKRVVYPISMDEIITRLDRQTDGWPRRVDGALFVHDPHHGIAWLEKPQATFGWLHRRVGKVTWHAGRSMVGREELHAELRRTARNYVAVENVPHEPPMAGHYYACDDTPPGDGSALADLLSRFRPSTDIDADLIRAAFMTCMWGGPPGARPCFVITSDDGRGAGKSTLAEIVGELFGGILQFSHVEDVASIKTRLLSPTALTQRVALLDNVKSHKFSWGDLEGLITGTTIGGHRLYAGEATRPNTLTWFLTLNGAALSCDMAQRSVVIKINKPPRSATWLDEIRQYIADHRRRILGDIIAALRGPTYPLRQFSRWATWERDILQRLPEPADAQKVIADRQNVADVDGEEAAVVQDFFADQLQRYGYDIDRERIFISSQTAATWLHRATGDRHSVIAASRILTQMATEGRLRNIEAKAGRSQGGRGFVWSGDETSILTPTAFDLAGRVREESKNHML